MASGVGLAINFKIAGSLGRRQSYVIYPSNDPNYFISSVGSAGRCICIQCSPPEEALKTFEVAPGLKVELVAGEPLVASPCAMAFDGKGRLFVAENRGYPIGPKEGERPAGVIAMLEDTDGDGRMDKRTVFADGLTFPNGVLPWKGGIIVTCAPDIIFLRDHKGTGVADERPFSAPRDDTARASCGMGRKAISFNSIRP